jgi:hypothetical protein
MQQNVIQGSTKTVYLKLYNAGTTTPATGKTVAVTLSKNGGAFANPSAGATNATEIANGWYYVALSATDTATIGPLVVLGQASGCDNVDPLFDVVPGVVLSSVPYPSVNTAGIAGVAATQADGTAAAVTSSSITLTAPSNDPRTASNLAGWEIDIVSATANAGQRVIITAYNASTQVATISSWPLGTPTGTVTYNLIGPVVTISNLDKTGYSLTQTFPTNFGSLAISAGGAVTAGTVSDKTGYSLTQTFPTNFGALAISAGGAVTAGTVSDKAGYSLNLAQTGLSPRALDTVADASLTVGDALVAAVCQAAGKKTVIGTAYTVETPSTGTVIRTFSLDSATSPTQAN